MIPGPVGRLLVTWLASAGALLLLSALMRDVEVPGPGAALVAAALTAAVNGAIWPIVLRLTLPLTVLTLGFGVLLLNGAVVLLVAALLPGVEVDGLGTAVLVVLGLTLVTTLVTSILAIDEEERVGRHLVRRAVRSARGAEHSDVPGVLFLEIDGLAHSVLRRALRDGNAPALARWIREGTHRLTPWETDWSSQTGACQAGLLHGRNDDLPAFRWWEKERDGPIVTNHPGDAAEIERRVSDGRGLLHGGGASRANILSGDAPHSLLTMSTVLAGDRHGAIGRDYFTYMASPYNVARTLLLSIVDVAGELRAAREQRRRDVQPRVHRGLRYALIRAWATVVQRDLQVQAVLGDVYAGRPVVYTTFLGYDEVAHHSGIERPETLAVLRQVDLQVERIARAAAVDAPRPYEIVVLSDHGQTQGATFRRRYGETLDEVVRRACATEDVEVEESGEDEARGRIGAAVTEAAQGSTRSARAVARAQRRALPPSTEDGHVPEVSVMASGCLGLISFPRLPGRVRSEDIGARYPRLLPALTAHPGVGFVLVRSRERGAVVLGASGIRCLEDGDVVGDDPLGPFGPNAAAHVARTDRFAHCPDVVVNSTYWPETGEVAAFEELVGSHGGMGGTQTAPFVLSPARFALPDRPIVGAEALHRVMRGWLADLGHAGYRA
ncbi:MAG TPA: phage holin family protein [Solirubrobacteraceae bacterium]|nr:phage holin family protein [Solirubrobacteraceae bacterium]